MNLTTSKNQTQRFSSLYLVEQINLFRKQEEGKSMLAHSDFLKSIQNEFEEELHEGNISVSQYSQKMPTGGIKFVKMYELNFEESLQMLMKESKIVRKQVVKILKEQEIQIQKYETPLFIKRHYENYDRLDKGYFSVISELYVRLYGKFEMIGYKIPDKALDGKEIRPDVSVGKLFATYLKDNLLTHDNDYKTYTHKFPSGIQVEARQYKNDLLSTFVKFINNCWIPQNAEKYFKERDLIALKYLPKLLV